MKEDISEELTRHLASINLLSAAKSSYRFDWLLMIIADRDPEVRKSVQGTISRIRKGSLGYQAVDDLIQEYRTTEPQRIKRWKARQKK